MIPLLRRQFNSAWTPKSYDRFLDILTKQFGEPPPFRLSETPCFLTSELVARVARYGREIVDQLVGSPEYMRRSDVAIPASWRAPNDQPNPLFVQADFGIDAQGDLQLVEIQGFPSLYGFQPSLIRAYREAFNLDNLSLDLLPDSLKFSEYITLFREAVVGQHHPENVALLEIDPWRQKTRQDFKATEELLGISIVDAQAVLKLGARLYYDRAGTLVPIHRIYNRVIADEVERRGIHLPFDFRDELNVEWAGHPNWFYRLSKLSLPFVHHPAVPESFFLHDAPPIEDPSAWVLKPLYSFAGTGVIVGPSREQLDSIDRDERENYLLQKRVAFEPVIDTPDGRTKIEIRVMYIWLSELRPVNLIIRMGRGSQMGVDFNKGLGWVGASAAFIAPGDGE